MIGRAGLIRRRDEPSKLRLALWGAIGTAAFLLIAVGTTVYGTGALSGHPEVTAEVSADTTGVPNRAPIEYQGVLVGTVIDVETHESSSTVTMRISERHAESITTAAQVRVLPRTLFGDLFVELVPADGTAEAAAEPISDGDRLAADDSAEAVQIYEAFDRLTSLLAEIEPAKINQALSAVAQLLDGRGERFGRMLDQLHELTDDVDDFIALIDDGMDAASTVSEQAVEATPDALRALRDAVEISRTIVAEQRTIERVLASGITLADEGSRVARSDNVDRYIRLSRTADPVLDELATDPTVAPRAVENVRHLLEAAIPTYEQGPWFRIRANLTAVEPFPYTVEDCPRYGDEEGPNCPDGAGQQERRQQEQRYGGTSGPVGSEAEREVLAELLDAAPGDLGAAGDDEASGAVGVLLGPLLRGTEVEVP
ncbi:MCE family protein [Haloechinothrix sp. LS1_15]|uniref:MCE family protein n=1 Tax=Haloechinothrix sp. LS1_15 TaxID=2652248 RepID=UPI0029480ECA|nr:MCE family protein [Haloechinothrix sp. LS1_15]MDV6013761.1 MCE family protein [Haloechinothrix sp. LS1_15]